MSFASPVKTSLCVFVVAIVVVMTAGAEIGDGEVEGTFTMNGQTVGLEHGYVVEKDGDFIIYLTDSPVEYRELHRLWTRQDVNYVQLKFDPEGSNFGQDLKHEARGSTISGGGTQKIEFETFGPTSFVGRAFLPEPVEFFDSTYQYEVTFKLELPSLEDLGGSALPADGGEPGKAYLAWNAACSAGDIDAIKELVPPEMAAELDQKEGREALEFMRLMTPTDVTVLGGNLFGDEAELEVEGIMDGARGQGTVTMAKHGDYWVEAGTKWRAGPTEEAEEPEPDADEGDPGERRYTTEVVSDLNGAVAMYTIGTGQFPGPTDGWVEIRELAEEIGHRMADLPTTDAWGRAILYRCDDPSQGFRLVSTGPDGEVSEEPGSDDIVATELGLGAGSVFDGGDETYLLLKQRDTARALREAAHFLEAYYVEEMAYPVQSGGLSTFDVIAMDISGQAELSKHPAYGYSKIPVKNAWGDAFLYWSDTQSYRLLSIGPDRTTDQDWIEQTQASNPDGDDIVISDGLVVFIPEGVEKPE